MSSSKKIYFAAWVSQSLYSLEVGRVGIFDPALGTLAPLIFSLASSPLPCVYKYTSIHVESVGGGGCVGS